MIELKNIWKIYKNDDLETVALKNISLEIKEGEFVAIMGPSGSGKSTLMHILGCLDTPTSGKYFLDGEDISKMNDDELAEIRNKKIGFVFQSFNLLPKTNVLRNVELPLVYAGISPKKRQERAKEALNLAAFPNKFWYHFSNQLSGGMMQRVAIARALVNDPKIILADEPTGNLDTKTGEIVLETFQNLHDKHGRTIILITHEPYIAEYAQRIIKIKDGELIDDFKNNNRRIINNK
ncbi:MAG: ABC transporter ATP-binding protein [Patescibacteria group bacterium]|nr:ABC transporter ATP-binding protein [Patescibacteria group bacterium]MDW8279975.1 ABC transporter ATP-binding protein [bacterium]